MIPRAALIGFLLALCGAFYATARVLPAGGGAVPSAGPTCGTGGVCATTLTGQTAITWTDLATGAAGNAYRYKLYESSSPITIANYTSATLAAQQIPNNSGQIFGDCPDHLSGWAFTQANRQTAAVNLGTSSCQGEMMPLSFGGPEPPSYSGLWVRTVPSNRAEYYAVVGNNGSDTFIGSVGPITETSTTPVPIQIRDSSNRIGDPSHAFSIPGAAAGLGVNVGLHASQSTGGSCVTSVQSVLGDVWIGFGDPTMAYQDGVPFVFCIARQHSLSPQILTLDWRESWWFPNYSDGRIESIHRHLGVIPSAQTQAAYGADAGGHMYPFAIKRLKWIFDFVRAHYGSASSISLASDNWICTGESMGSWGCSQWVIKEYPLYFAASFVNKGPLFQQYNDQPSGYANVCGATMPFSAGACSTPLGTNPALITLPDGSPWGGTGGATDLVSQIANATTDLTPFYWGLGKHDGFASWSVVLDASAAYETSVQCHGFGWNDMGHSQGDGPLRSLWKQFTGGAGYGYDQQWFKTDQAIPCFANSSINDDPGTGATTGGEPDGDVVGCIDCGFNWTRVEDSAGAVEFTIGNSFMGNAATTIPTNTLAADMTAGQTTLVLNNAAGFSCSSSTGNPFLRVGTGASVEIVGCISIAGNTITITRGQLDTTAHTHTTGDTVIGLPLQPTGPNIGPQTSLTVDVMVRQRQVFHPSPSTTLTCTYTPNGGGAVTSHPTVDANGNWTTVGVVVNSSGTTDYRCTNP